MNERKKLSDILRGSTAKNLQSMERNRSRERPDTASARRIFVSHSGWRTVHVQTRDPGYKLTLEVTEGEHEGRRCWHDVLVDAGCVAAGEA